MEKFYKGEYLNSHSVDYDEIPRKVEGFALVQKYINKLSKWTSLEVDYLFIQWGMGDVVPPSSRMTLISMAILLPFTILLVLSYCLNERDEVDKELEEEQ